MLTTSQNPRYFANQRSLRQQPPEDGTPWAMVCFGSGRSEYQAQAGSVPVDAVNLSSC